MSAGNGTRQLGELIYRLGIEHANFQNEIAKKIGRAMSEAFDDGFVLGRQTGEQDAANRESGPREKAN